MSYDLMVFDPDVPPNDRKSFMAWYDKQTEWSEQHSDNDPVVATPALQAWFQEMIQFFPPMSLPSNMALGSLTRAQTKVRFFFPLKAVEYGALRVTGLAPNNLFKADGFAAA